MKTPIKWLTTGVITLLILSTPAYAAVYTTSAGEDAAGTTSVSDVEYVGGIVKNVVHVSMGVICVLSIVIMLWGAFTLGTAAGRENRAHTGRKLLIASTLTLLVSLASWGIIIWTTNNILDRIIENI